MKEEIDGEVYAIELQSVMQSGLNIIDSYQCKEFELDFNNYLVYVSRWKQTINESKKTFSFKKVKK